MDAQAMLADQYKCAYPCDPPCEYVGDAHHMFVPEKSRKIEELPLLKAVCPRHRKLMEKINWRMRHETMSHAINKLCAKPTHRKALYIPSVRSDVLARIDPSKRNKVSNYRHKGRR